MTWCACFAFCRHPKPYDNAIWLFVSHFTKKKRKFNKIIFILIMRTKIVLFLLVFVLLRFSVIIFPSIYTKLRWRGSNKHANLFRFIRIMCVSKTFQRCGRFYSIEHILFDLINPNDLPSTHAHDASLTATFNTNKRWIDLDAEATISGNCGKLTNSCRET